MPILKKENVILQEEDAGKIKELKLYGYEEVKKEDLLPKKEEKSLNKLNKDEIKAKLAELEIEFDKDANKDVLLQQLQEASSN
ncbi:hypothetical protein [Paraliobacillus ryukyuensis]|uniref:hypothetical protein n=1 Tax=Paraliobacillus ryukyuensis TaxID=200904 RepID=UPI0009A6AE67|nr:hypothetical protein [Paraliobacillus ryukyuensis]